MKKITLGCKKLLDTVIPVSLLSILATTPALAWKPTTHVYLAEQAMKEAVEHKKITIYRVDYQTGKVLLDQKIGDYNVDPGILDALTKYPSRYRAGVLGPDAYPDILTGQQVIHPGPKDSGVAGGSNEWLEYIWNESVKPNNNKPWIKAFVVGYLTHAAGDMYGHTFINHFTGGSFAIEPPNGPENAIKHIVLEGYIDKRVPAPTYDVSIDGVQNFIYNSMINATPGSYLNDHLLRREPSSTDLSVPRLYSTLRAELEDYSKGFSDRLDYFNGRIDDKLKAADDCKWWDTSCSAVKLVIDAAILGTQRTVYVVANKLPVEYARAWRNDIDDGLKAWPNVSHEVAKALFFNPEKKANVEKAKKIIEDYYYNHLLSMSGTPDAVGIIGKAISNLLDVVKIEPFKKLKRDFYNTMLKEATGMTTDDLKKYLSSPENYFELVMEKGSGEKVSLQELNRKYLGLADKGYKNPEEKIDYQKVPAAYNTVLMSKLILLAPSEVNRLVKDLGSTSSLKSDNIMLGFIRTLDGDNEWSKGMALAQDCKVYTQVFMKQPGENENSPCSVFASNNVPKLVGDSNNVPKYFCDPKGEPLTYISTGSEQRPVIRWNSNYFKTSGYNPKKRCLQVSARIQQAQTEGTLSNLTYGYINGVRVLCIGTTPNAHKCRPEGNRGLILTLQKGQSSRQSLKNMKDALFNGGTFEDTRDQATKGMW